MEKPLNYNFASSIDAEGGSETSTLKGITLKGNANAFARSSFRVGFVAQFHCYLLDSEFLGNQLGVEKKMIYSEVHFQEILILNPLT